MHFEHQNPFEESEVSQILQSLRDSDRRLHEEAIAERDALRAQFEGDWFANTETLDARPDQMDDALAALDSLLAQQETLAKPHTTLPSEIGLSATLEPGLFAGEPSYALSCSQLNPEGSETSPSDVDFPQRQVSTDATHSEFGVNAKTGRPKQCKRSLCTPGRAGLVAGFHSGHAERVGAISKLHIDLDQDQIQALLKTDAFIQKLMQSYHGTGELPGWAKFVTPEMKQFFRLFLLCKAPDANTITIRLDHHSAESALSAPRGPANYLAEIIKRTLAKLGIETDLAFNLEFNHTGSTENHPLHIHGALCIPDDRIDEVTEALRSALAEGYRKRYTNLAVLIEKPRSAQCWATYCIKEYGITAMKLSAERGRKSRPDYASQKITQQAKAFYEGIGVWLIS